jgi:hypothetical protein
MLIDKLHYLLFAVLLMIPSFLTGQITIKGCVTDKRTGEALLSVNVYIKGSYDGTITGADGCYFLEVAEDQDITLVFSFVGYESVEKSIRTVDDIRLNVSMKESITCLNAVTITAGSFEAGDKKRAAVMDPMDIYTTAGSVGDIGAALSTLPGTQVAPDDGRLLVRGGDASETRVLMDGVLAAKPYYSKVPDLPTRGKFSPSLFEGTFFSTGGYSAEYGQALSSVLVLESQDVAVEDLTSISLMSIGGELARTWSGNDRSFSANCGYYNFGPYNSLVKNYIDWEEPVEVFNGNISHRQRKENGCLFKLFASGNYGGQSFRVPDGAGDIMKIDDKGGGLYVNSTYQYALSDKTMIKGGASLTYDNQNMKAGIHHQDTRELVSEAKVKLISRINNKIKVTWGGGWQTDNFREIYHQQESDFSWKTDFTDYLISTFTEAEWHPNSRIAFRPGLRFEYSSQSKENLWSPRIALAYGAGENTTFSLAWGDFFQMVQADYLKYNRNIKMQKAKHFILGFQTGKLTTRLLRAEVFHKNYINLITGEYNSYGEFVPSTNNGEGYASGFDLFYRDKTLMKNSDFWVSYSYINSKRQFLDYPEKIVPEFISPHTFNVVGKYFIVPVRTQVSFTWTWNSGGPYHVPGDADFMSHTSPNYSNIEMNFSHLTSIFGNYTIVHFSISNFTGRNNVLGYRRIPVSGENGERSLVTIRPDVKQFMFMGIFISIE